MTTALILKPCPFCAHPAEADFRQHYVRLGSGLLDHQAAIYCTDCDANMTLCRADTPELSDEERMAVLAERWNRRPAENPAFLFPFGARLRKRRGAAWQGAVCGFYTTALTPVGYAIESERERHSVQIYPESALERVTP